MPQQLGDRYILVNIGGYLVQLVEHDQIQMEKRTIIGRPMRNTPSFTTRVTHLVLNPTWTVPRRIAVEDLLPEHAVILNTFYARTSRSSNGRGTTGWSRIRP